MIRREVADAGCGELKAEDSERPHNLMQGKQAPIREEKVEKCTTSVHEREPARGIEFFRESSEMQGTCGNRKVR